MRNTSGHGVVGFDEPQLPALLALFRAKLGESAVKVSDHNLAKFLRWKADVARAAERFSKLREWQSTPDGSFLYTPNYLQAIQDPMLRKVLESGIIVCPDGMRDKYGHKLLVGRLRFNDFGDGRTPADIVRMALYTIEHALQDPDTQRGGLAIFQDMRDVGPSNISLSVPRMLLPALFGHYPVKMKAIYILNAPFFFSHMIFPVIKMMMPAKLQERIFFLSSLSELYEHIDQQSLFAEHGGARSHDQMAWVAARVAEEQNQASPQRVADISLLMSA
eukprot:TRINITY_DN58049_c0_g1_i1.p1 TRINITY_DN58049_c0_g1~~TRINITY_DN58049_c0_g1_i1.p1  ORF type:complete len:300 (-),score=43.69 TRINITY_DN58049_c0_g1_i1:13-840(-)